MIVFVVVVVVDVDGGESYRSMTLVHDSTAPALV